MEVGAGRLAKNGADIPEPVSVERALDLLGDETRSVDSTIALTAVGLDLGLSQSLSVLPCVTTNDGRRIVPPQKNSPEAIAIKLSPLAEQLGVFALIHRAHLNDGKAARTVLNWLRETGGLLDEPDDRVVVRRLAAAGRSGRPIKKPLTDAQVESLRLAFELIDPAERQTLGPCVGRAVRLQAFEYEMRGRRIKRKSMNAYPVETYLPSAVDRGPDSFAAAAAQSSGITWLSNHYARTLRSSVGRAGVGAQRFLRLLGAETAPRLRSHPRLKRRYNDERRGLHIHVSGSPTDRTQALSARGATYTLQDRDCPDLIAVVRDIARIRRDKKKRRRRAAALVTTLARAWERIFADFSEVDAVFDYHSWRGKGQIAAYWLWVARDVAWLDDESGTPRRPCDLRVRTPGNEAIYGQNSPDYLHPDLHHPSWSTVLDALGVTGDPSRSELVVRLKDLRVEAKNEGHWTSEEIKRETAILYKALAQSIASVSNRSYTGVEQLRRDFQHGGGLVFTNLGWLPPQGVLAGPPIFGDYKAFAPAVADTEPLWTALRLREPAFDDCLDVIRAVARARGAPGPRKRLYCSRPCRHLTFTPKKASIGKRAPSCGRSLVDEQGLGAHTPCIRG